MIPQYPLLKQQNSSEIVQRATSLAKKLGMDGFDAQTGIHRGTFGRALCSQTHIHRGEKPFCDLDIDRGDSALFLGYNVFQKNNDLKYRLL
ncbi:MAG TPA: hypothetical protein VK158_04075 [Acidobacteriota bacterium]|nr:hypothetical protein [Acidobacteriota bacterium]